MLYQFYNKFTKLYKIHIGFSVGMIFSLKINLGIGDTFMILDILVINILLCNKIYKM